MMQGIINAIGMAGNTTFIALKNLTFAQNLYLWN